jgi:hypothetical protein
MLPPQVVAEVLDRIEGREDVPVAEEPLEPLEFANDVRLDVLLVLFLSVPVVGPSWWRGPQPLASWPMTVMRMVTWNQSSRCSERGFRYRGMSRTSSAPSVVKTTRWFGAIP